MSAGELSWLDACATRERVAAGRLGAREVTRAALERIERLEPAVGALFEVLAERALERAEALDRAFANGRRPGSLAGVPLVLKANMCLEGVEANCGSAILAGYRPPYTATFVERALAADAVPVAVAHMDEFGMGSSGENSAYGTPRNPWDPTRTPGGSSSGCAAAVAAGMVPLALGSDTGGSVRQPAALSGIAGFKPTYGRVSRYGLVAFGSSLDVVAPLARSVRDLQRATAVVGGRDPFDATSHGPAEAEADLEREGDLAGLRLGIAPELFPDTLDADVAARVEEAIAACEAAGARRVPLELPAVPHALAMYYVLVSAEASSNLARFDGVRYGRRAGGDGSLEAMHTATRSRGFGPEVKRRILLGTFALSSGYHDEWYARARRARGRLCADFARAFERVDLLVAPTSPTPAFPLGERRDDPVAMYAADVLTVPASLAGVPAASVPAGLVERGDAQLPIGLQWIGPRGADERVLAAARAFERLGVHGTPRPPVAGGATA